MGERLAISNSSSGVCPCGLPSLHCLSEARLPLPPFLLSFSVLGCSPVYPRSHLIVTSSTLIPPLLSQCKPHHRVPNDGGQRHSLKNRQLGGAAVWTTLTRPATAVFNGLLYPTATGHSLKARFPHLCRTLVSQEENTNNPRVRQPAAGGGLVPGH